MVEKRGRGRPKKEPTMKEVILEFMPTDDMFMDGEKDVYEKLIKAYLADFDESQLTTNDMDDIMSLAMNRIIELRLLKDGKTNVDRHLDVSTAVERLRKQSDKIKENLGTRRKDRIDPRKFSGFSIVDLAVAFDESRKSDIDKKLRAFAKEEQEIRESGVLDGNRYDPDADAVSDEDD